MIRGFAQALAVLLLMPALAAGRASGAASADDIAAHAGQEILVMLRMPPAHFRPEAAYGGAYDVRFGRAARQRLAAELARSYGLTLVSDWPMPALGVECYVMELPAGASAERVADRVAQDGRADWAQPMNVFWALGHDDPLFGLQPGARAWHLDEIHARTTGRNVLVAEIDSGVDVAHPDLAGQVALARDFVGSGGVAAEGHGTAVAGIIAARADNGIGIVGVAPGARLLALRACAQVDGGAAACSSFTLAKALQFALDHGARVINMSLSGPPDRLLDRLLGAAAIRGIALVAAADPDRPDGGFPASHADVIAVARDDAPAAAASIVAPGVDIPTTLPAARWGLVSGSSFAAAHVTGMVALIRELAPALDPRQIRAELQAGSRTVAGRLDGYAPAPAAQPIDACAIVARLTARCACGCALAGHAMTGLALP